MTSFDVLFSPDPVPSVPLNVEDSPLQPLLVLSQRTIKLETMAEYHFQRVSEGVTEFLQEEN